MIIVFQTCEDESKGTAIDLLHASVYENYQSNGLTLGLSKGDSCNILEKYSIVSKKLEGGKASKQPPTMKYVEPYKVNLKI